MVEEDNRTPKQKEHEADIKKKEATEDEIKKIVALQDKCSKGKCIVRYHANWCGHCVQMKDIWAQFNEKNPTYNIISFEENTFKHMNPQPDVRGFPTIKMLSDGNVVGEDFQGEKTVENFEKFYNEANDKTSKVEEINEIVSSVSMKKTKDSQTDEKKKQNKKSKKQTNKKQRKKSKKHKQNKKKTNKKH
jgi:thioredoxin-like negative regulator of GroEL